MSRLQSAAGRVPQGWSFGDWPLRRKLAAAVVLPIVLAFVFGGLRVKNDFDSSTKLDRAADTVLVIRPVVEYNLAVQRLAAAGGVGGGGVIAAITKYESAAADLRIALKTPGIPESVRRSGSTALTLGQAVRSAKTQNGFSDVVIDRSGGTATLMSTAVADLGLADDSASAKIVVAIQDTIAAQRAMTGQQLNLANTDDGAATLRAIGQVGAETAALTRLQTEVPDSGPQVRQLLNDNGRRNYTLQQASIDKDQLAALGTVIESSNAGYTKLLDGELVSLETNLRNRAADFRTTAILNAVIVAAALIAALAIVLALLRSLLVPIRAVRQGALDVANKRLPAAVAAMRDGTEPPEFVAIPVHTSEEMGQLARAVDDLHNQALTLAGEQARLRVQVGHMFETLSRRSTSLIDQQLSLIERLESDEEDPKRLQSLFRLDHLAARMRRNSDSLLVLAGTSTRRGVSGSVSVSDAVRAAVSEVENYERIDIGDTSNDHVLGAVGSDLIHLLAEVVDNALAYSPPTTRVGIRGARTPEGGLLIEVDDKGLGMPPRELAALNDRLAHGGDITPDTARRMGLFVVGSLAKRHGIAVRLRRNGADRQGVTVSVHLPAGLLADTARADRPARAAAAAAAAVAAPAAPAAAPSTTSAVGGTTKAGLPTRVRGASGAPSVTPSPVPGAAKKFLPTRTPGAHGPTTGGGLPAIPAKPVIEGAAAAAEEKAATNGHAAPVNGTDGAPPAHGTNGAAPAHGTNGAAPAQDDAAVADGQVDRGLKDAEDVKSSVEPTAAESEAPKADAPEAAVTTTGAEKVEAAKVDEPEVAAALAEAPKAEEPQAPVALSAAGLPVRKPRATGITEYREFQDAPSAPEAEGRSEDRAAAKDSSSKGSRLTSWLPGRKAAEAARAEAEAAAEPHRMPSNLSAWLDHRAKLTEAREQAENGVTSEDATSDATTHSPTDPAHDSATHAVSSAPTTTELHVPKEWVEEARSAEAPQADASAPEAAATTETEARAAETVEAPVAEAAVVETAAVETALPTRVPGASASPTAALADPQAAGTRPVMRAHNTSFFGARKARAVQPTTEAAEAPVAEAPVAEAPTEAVTEQPTEAVTEQAAEVSEVPEAPQASESHDSTSESHDSTSEGAEAAEQGDADGQERPLNDTPIFRAMMSSWLTTDPAPSQQGEAWTGNEGDEALFAAHEETRPLEESAAGLPKRRPGNSMIPGGIDQQDEQPAATAVSRRDPEAIRRNLNRHKNGVSSARTEAQDGTHREEADVHH